jgi:hypothetical protein
VKIADLTGPMWRTHADLRRRVSRRGGEGPALEVIGTSDRSDLDRWNAATEAAREAYRTTVALATGSLAVVCVSNRPWQLANVLANVRRQRHPVPEFLLVLNTDDVGLSQVSDAMAVLDGDGVRWSLLSRSSDISLGHCLNAALGYQNADEHSQEKAVSFDPRCAPVCASERAGLRRSAWHPEKYFQGV